MAWVAVDFDGEEYIYASEPERSEEQPDDRQELHCCINGSAQIFP